MRTTKRGLDAPYLWSFRVPRSADPEMHTPAMPPWPMLISGCLQSPCSVPPTIFSFNPTSLEKHIHFTDEKPKNRKVQWLFTSCSRQQMTKPADYTPHKVSRTQATLSLGHHGAHSGLVRAGSTRPRPCCGKGMVRGAGGCRWQARDPFSLLWCTDLPSPPEKEADGGKKSRTNVGCLLCAAQGDGDPPKGFI